MNLHEAMSDTVGRKRKSRVGRGRGSGWGKTSRRGQKGASSRTGWGGGIMREGGQMPLVRRLPKKGFGNSEFRIAYEVVNVERLPGLAADGRVTPDVLKAAGLIKKSARYVKVLGKGDLAAALKVEAHHFSKGAREKIEKAGGAVTVLPGRHGKQAEASRGEVHAALAAVRAAHAVKNAAHGAKKKAKAAEADAADEAAKAEKAGKGDKPEKTEKTEKGEKGAAPKAAKKPEGKPSKKPDEKKQE